MEPDIIPSRSLDDDGNGEARSEEGDFGKFSLGVSCSPPGFVDSSDSPSSLRQPSPTIKPASSQPNCSFNQQVKQSQPTNTVNSESNRRPIDVEGQDHNAESGVHLTNGYSERDHNSGTHMTSVVGVCSSREETGFADFTVFTEQEAHPWCCGFTPLGSTEQWDGRQQRTNSSNGLGEQIGVPRPELIMESEPRPQCAYQAKVCTVVNKHCEKRDAAIVLPSQDHHQPQEAAAAWHFAGEPGDSRKFRSHSFNSLQTAEMEEAGESEQDKDQEKNISASPKSVSLYESPSEEMTSFCDDLSFEGPSAGSEPNVSSLASEDQTDWDSSDDEEEELGNYSNSNPSVNNNWANLRQSKAEGFHYCDQSATQETSATSNQSQTGPHTDGKVTDLKACSSSEHHGDGGLVQTADAGVQILGNLPPSDSFADFCSAPTQEDGGGSWAEFGDQRAQEEGRTWTQSRDQISNLQIDGNTEEEDRAGRCGSSCQVGDVLLMAFLSIVFISGLVLKCSVSRHCFV